MRKFLFSIFFLALLIINQLSFIIKPAFAQATSQEVYMKGQVMGILSEKTQTAEGASTLTQTLKVKILDGKDVGKTVVIERGNDVKIAALQKSSVGDIVVVDKIVSPNGQSQYTITDTYRLNNLLILAIIFLAIAIFVAGKKGFGAILGLGISLLVILFYIVPSMLHGQDALTVSILGSMVILIVTTFLAHGISRQTAIAVTSTFLALILTYIFAKFSVGFSHIAGLGTEDSYLLELDPSYNINPQGLFLGGIIIGTLGALNDITTTQVASIFALFKANREQTFLHLIEHGFAIGKEHIASLINTLVLAYAGTSLTIFIFLIVNPQHLPYWVIINTEEFSQEIVRTITGSVGLILSVPIATILAAILAPKFLKEKNP